ncbi:YigZ family protein [Lactobacillus sp. PV034]|uniref:YigZ family protein n=1 Tax=Lactobacillus sp. PV034 TaxID=2594495 RepID=UPI00224098F3|nr:YigZ family protein [Lactobacillus sp. PV034]QNQ80727.1 YigZ family protein [Lactobacillus sp. PV034]
MSTKNSYLTIKENGSNEIIIKKSKFICSMARTSTIDEAQAFIKKISKKYHDATHNTYAYTIGINDDQVKASDNGEPAGTAGVPELKALQLMKLKNVTAVVTRYFGGTKLGSGGLIRAYSNSIIKAAETIGVVRCSLQQEINFTISYSQVDSVNNLLKQKNIAIINQNYTTAVTYTIMLDLEEVDPFKAELIDFLSGNVTFTLGEKRFNETLLKTNNLHEQ